MSVVIPLDAMSPRTSISSRETSNQAFVQLVPPDRVPKLPRLVIDTLQLAGKRLQRAFNRVRHHVQSEATQVADIPSKCGHSCVEGWRYYTKHWGVLRMEVLCGIASTLLMIPETVAFSYVANLSPLMGLTATGLVGIILGIAGGVPSSVAGAAGALAVILPSLTSSTGALGALSYDLRVDHVIVAVWLSGCLQFVFGLLDWTRFFSMIPRTVHMGFLNGLAIMMTLSQRPTFQVCKQEGLVFSECQRDEQLDWMSWKDSELWMTLLLVVVTMVIMHFWTRVPRVGHLVPPTLVAAVVCVAIEFGIHRPLLGGRVRTIGETSPLAGSFPKLHALPFGNITEWSSVLTCAASLAVVGILESLMTLQAVVDLHQRLQHEKKEKDDTKLPDDSSPLPQLSRTACRRECLAQAFATMICGWCRAMSGCSMIGQSTANVLNGAKHRVSAVSMGITMLAVVSFASPCLERVPVACLSGILFVVILNQFCWPSLRCLVRARTTDAAAIVLVTALAAAINLAVAVAAGVVWQALVHGWQTGQRLEVRISVDRVAVEGTDEDENVKVYALHGPLQYSSVARCRAFFSVINDPRAIVVDLEHCELVDFSAVAVLQEVALRYRSLGKTLALRNADEHASALLLERADGWERRDNLELVMTQLQGDVDDEGLEQRPASAFALASPAATSYQVLRE